MLLLTGLTRDGVYLVENGYQEGEHNPPGRPGHSPERIIEALAGCRAAIRYERVSGAPGPATARTVG